MARRLASLLMLMVCFGELPQAMAQNGLARHQTVAPSSGGDVWGRDDAYSLAQDAVLDVAEPGVLSNDLGLEGEGLTALLNSEVSHGHLVLNPNGCFTYAPDAGYIGPDSFTYQAKSGDTISKIVTVTLDVTTPKSKAETIRANPPRQRRLDLAICGLDGGSPIEPGAGIGIQNQDGANQMVSLSHAEGESKAAQFLIELYNRGSASDAFVFKASAPGRGWNLRFFDAARKGNDITHEITSETGWTSGSISSNNSRSIRLEASPAPFNSNAFSGSAVISAFFAAEETAIGALKATDTVPDTVIDTVPDTVKAVFGFQRIAKLQFSLDQGENWLDAPLAGSGKAIVAPSQSIIGLRAVRFNASLPWPLEPDLKPAWDFDKSWFVGEAVWLDCGTSSEQVKPIQAECGNVLIANLRVTETFHLSLRPSAVYVALGGGELGRVSLVAKVTRSNGQPVAGATVRFTAKFENGAAAGETTGPGAQPDRAITDANGVASVTLTTGTVAGAVSVKAILMASNRDTAWMQEQEVCFGQIESEFAEPVDF